MSKHEADPDVPDLDPEGQVDRSKIDFDPADGFYTGTVVDGTTEIPGPHIFDKDKDES